MNKENVKAWVDALRSGEYEQGKLALKELMPDGTARYCCLGVATVLAGCPEKHKFGGNVRMVVVFVGDPLTGRVNSISLPETAQDWLGIPYDNPVVNYRGSRQSLIELNDEGVTFGVIAQAIEDTYLTEANEDGA